MVFVIFLEHQRLFSTLILIKTIIFAPKQLLFDYFNKIFNIYILLIINNLHNSFTINSDSKLQKYQVMGIVGIAEQPHLCT